MNEAIELGHQLSSKRLPNLEKFEEFYLLWRNPLAGHKRKTTGDFSLIIERITNDMEVTSSPDETSYAPKKSIDWKMAFYDEFIRYADRFYISKKTSSKRRTIGGERFSINKWSSNKINYFLTKNILSRNPINEYEKQIEQLYQ